MKYIADGEHLKPEHKGDVGSTSELKDLSKIPEQIGALASRAKVAPNTDDSAFKPRWRTPAQALRDMMAAFHV